MALALNNLKSVDMPLNKETKPTKPESVLENEMQKILWDFEIQTDHLIPARRPDLVITNNIKKRTCIEVVNVTADQRV